MAERDGRAAEGGAPEGAGGGLADIRITNCHVHLFTARHVPRAYPHPALAWIRRVPGLITGAAGLARAAGFEEGAARLSRLGRFAAAGRAGGQRAILAAIERQYPAGTRFVVLPMDLGGIGHGPAERDLRAQHDELARLARDPRRGGRVIPFATLLPDRPGAVAEVRRCVEDLGFRGLKLYPRLGYPPDHPVLMAEVYPYCVRHGLPVISHCSRGGVRGRGVSRAEADRWSAPQAFVPVLDAFPGLRVCLAHFGGQADWRAYVEDGLSPDDPAEGERNWQVAIRRMITAGDGRGGRRFPGLWTDVSYTLFEFEEFVPFLRLFLEDARLAGRVLFGSDFYMTRLERLSERAVCFRLRVALGEALFRQIAETNPRAWLGEEPLAATGRAAAPAAALAAG
ncbi:MAG: amidohydrolase [Rhodobacteraceae bacterium]|nr:amidohydrolase [Paracoccaceae bacterium]